MKQKFKYPRSVINTSQFVREGESIEEKMRRITQTKEPIEDSAPAIYQEKNSGVDPACDIRTDRFDLALEAIEKSYSADQATETAKGDNKPDAEPKEDTTYITE